MKGIKSWRMLAVGWPMLCLTFVGVILVGPGRTLEQRTADSGLMLIALIFFAIGMSVRRRLLRERGSSTALTAATVVSAGKVVRTGKNTVYFPEFQFQAGGTIYRVKSPSGSSFHHLSEGAQVELYYDPENPRRFYIPVLQKHDRRVSALLCGLGVLFPLAALFAPQLRALLAFLELRC